jgi:hypothetical protein
MDDIPRYIITYSAAVGVRSPRPPWEQMNTGSNPRQGLRSKDFVYVPIEMQLLKMAQSATIHEN